MVAISWVHLINAVLTSREKSHSPASKQMLSSLWNKATKYSNSCPQHKCWPSIFFFLPMFSSQLSGRTWLCPFIGVLKGKEESKALNEEPCDFGVSSPVLRGEFRCSEWQPGPAGDSRKGMGSSTVLRNRLQGSWRRHITVRAWLCGFFWLCFLENGLS